MHRQPYNDHSELLCKQQQKHKFIWRTHLTPLFLRIKNMQNKIKINMIKMKMWTNKIQNSRNTVAIRSLDEFENAVHFCCFVVCKFSQKKNWNASMSTVFFPYQKVISQQNEIKQTTITQQQRRKITAPRCTYTIFFDDIKPMSDNCSFFSGDGFIQQTSP